MPANLTSDPQDNDLLTRYTGGRSEAEHAFSQLVTRHGDMVYRTCLRIVGDPAAAEDAAQATFLVLAQKAGTVHGSLGAFLHAVAVNVSRRALAAERARKTREAAAAELYARRQAETDGHHDDLAARWADIEPHLDAGIDALPARQRQALVLQYLVGRPQEAIAREMGLARATVAKHVQLGLENLRHRLERRGLALADRDCLTLLVGLGPTGACPPFLSAAAGSLATGGVTAVSLTGAATASATQVSLPVQSLAKGVLHMMYWAKIKAITAAAIALVVVTASVSLTVHHLTAADLPPPATPPDPVPSPAPAAPPLLPAAPAAAVALKDLHPIYGAIPEDSRLAKQVDIRTARGVIVVRSLARLELLAPDLISPADPLKLTSPLVQPFRKLDFSTQMVIYCLVGNSGNETPALESLDGNARALQAKIKVTAVPVSASHPNLQAIAVTVPISQAVTVTLPDRVEERIQKPDGQFQIESRDVTRTWTLDANGGDVIDGLQGALRFAGKNGGAVVAPGADVQLYFDLRVADPKQTEPIYVWDNVYSEGYRNDAYLVIQPDGTSVYLRRAEVQDWDKNAPTLVAIQAGTPWTLGGPANSPQAKSLKGLGLDTTAAGVYTVYGLYQESTRPGGVPQTGGGVLFPWQGLIATPPLQFTVQAPAVGNNAAPADPAAEPVAAPPGTPANRDPDPAPVTAVHFKDLHPVQATIAPDSPFGSRLNLPGACGVIVVRSQARMDRLRRDLTSPQLAQGALPPGIQPFQDLDFSKQMVVYFFAGSGGGDIMNLEDLSGDTQLLRAKLGVMAVPTGASRASLLLIAVSVPSSQALTVFMPDRVEKRILKPDRTFRLESTDVQRTWTLDANGGDVTDGLQGRLLLDPQIKNQTIKPGEDLLLTFELRVADPKQAESIFVWSAVDQYGYRNDGYLVIRPDGVAQFLQAPVNLNWDGTPVGPREIKPGKPWAIGRHTEPVIKSLKKLGLNTTQEGNYFVYGIYQQATDVPGSALQLAVGDEKIVPWHGQIVTPPLQFTVRTEGAAAPAPGTPAGNATAQFIGRREDWSRCTILLRDLHPMWGGYEITLQGDGSATIHKVNAGKSRDFNLPADPDRAIACRDQLIACNLKAVDIPVRAGVPDEAHPQLIVTNAQGKTFTIAKWANDKVPAFDQLYKSMMELAQAAEKADAPNQVP